MVEEDEQSIEKLEELHKGLVAAKCVDEAQALSKKIAAKRAVPKLTTPKTLQQRLRIATTLLDQRKHAVERADKEIATMQERLQKFQETRDTLQQDVEEAIQLKQMVMADLMEHEKNEGIIEQPAQPPPTVKLDNVKTLLGQLRDALEIVAKPTEHQPEELHLQTGMMVNAVDGIYDLIKAAEESQVPKKMQALAAMCATGLRQQKGVEAKQAPPEPEQATASTFAPARYQEAKGGLEPIHSPY